MHFKNYISFTIVSLMIIISLVTVELMAMEDSGSGLVVAKARLMTPEEMAALGPGYGCETHCRTSGSTCSEINGWDGECCFFSTENICDNEVPEEECYSSWCGIWPDTCDKTCVSDDPADCGTMRVYTCAPAPCKKWGFLVGNYKSPPIYFADYGQCVDVFQCHTVDE